MMAKTYHLSKTYTQDQIQSIERQAEGKIDEILLKLGIVNLRKKGRFYEGPCPIHGGDKKNAFNIFHEGDSICGNWRCFTNNCHQIFRPSLTGFIRAYLSKTRYGWENRTSVQAPFIEAIHFLVKLINADVKESDLVEVEKAQFVRQTAQLYQNDTHEPQKTLNVDRGQIAKLLTVPSTYFLARGFTKEVLERYCIGDCTSTGKEMNGRAVVPIFDNETGKVMIGCTGRSLFEICPICKSYHNPTHQCPNEDYAWLYSKWKHNKGFKAEQYLYNFHSAQKFIKESRVIVLIESSSNVWRLEEAGIRNSVATFGAHLTQQQKKIIDMSGAMTIVSLYDPDHAGQMALEELMKMCGKTYSIVSPKFGSEDIASLSISKIKTVIQPIIDKIEKDYK